MKRNKPPVKPVPPVVNGLFSVSPTWADVLFSDIALAWRCIVGK